MHRLVGTGEELDIGGPAPQLPLPVNVGDSDADEQVAGAAGPHVGEEPQRLQGALLLLELLGNPAEDVSGILLNVPGQSLAGLYLDDLVCDTNKLLEGLAYKLSVGAEAVRRIIDNDIVPPLLKLLVLNRPGKLCLLHLGVALFGFSLLSPFLLVFLVVVFQNFGLGLGLFIFLVSFKHSKLFLMEVL